MSDRQAEQATQEQVRALVMAGVRAGADLRPAVFTALSERTPPMRELSVIVHLTVPAGDDRTDAAIAAEVADALQELGFILADAAEPCPPMRSARVVRDVVAGDG